MEEKPIVCFDIETTGLDKKKDQIIQFAGIKFLKSNPKSILDKLNIMIQPVGSYKITVPAYLKHGIKPADLFGKPHFFDVAQKIADFIGDCDILTFNGSSFDISFLNEEMKRCGIAIDFFSRKCYDSFMTEKRRNGNSLDKCYMKYKGKSMKEAGLTSHDAFSDVKATISIFFAQNREKPVEPEKMISEDNSICESEFKDSLEICFNKGKYKDVPLKIVKMLDKDYMEWCLTDKCPFSDSAKNIIKGFLK